MLISIFQLGNAFDWFSFLEKCTKNKVFLFIAIFVHIRSQAYQHPDCWPGRCPQILPVFRECVRKNDFVYGISQSVWGQHESLQPDSQTMRTTENVFQSNVHPQNYMSTILPIWWARRDADCFLGSYSIRVEADMFFEILYSVRDLPKHKTAGKNSLSTNILSLHL